MEKNASVRCGKNWLKNTQNSLITLRSKRFGKRQEKERWASSNPGRTESTLSQETRRFAFNMPTTTKVGVICLLEFKRMSDVTNHYVVRAKREAERQYESLISALGITMQRQGWMGEQVSFIAGARSLNEEELKKNLECFKVPSASIEHIRSKLAMKIFDEYANILKGMYSIRFNGRSDHGDTPTRPVLGPTSPLINSLTV